MLPGAGQGQSEGSTALIKRRLQTKMSVSPLVDVVCAEANDHLTFMPTL